MLDCISNFFAGYPTKPRQAYRAPHRSDDASLKTSEEEVKSTHSFRKYLANYDVFRQSILSLDNSSTTHPASIHEEPMPPPEQPYGALTGILRSSPTEALPPCSMTLDTLGKDPHHDDEYGKNLYPSLAQPGGSPSGGFPSEEAVSYSRMVGASKASMEPLKTSTSLRKTSMNASANATHVLPTLQPGSPPPRKSKQTLGVSHNREAQPHHTQKPSRRKDKKYDEWMYQLDELEEQYGRGRK